MKRILSFIIMLSIALFITACKQDIYPLPSTAVETEPTSEQIVLATEENARPQRTQLLFYQDGKETAAYASLFSAEGYSIYIFDDDWSFQSDVINGCSVITWKNISNENAKLCILKMETDELPTVQSWVKDTFSEYDFLEDNQGGLGGTNADEDMVDAQIELSAGMSYVVIKMYSLKDAETFGILLNVMADTLQPVTPLILA